MFESYQRALNPKSILDVLGKDVLQSMMQGSFYKQRAGLTLFYDEQLSVPGKTVLCQVEPSDDFGVVRSSNFNPFCALFRRDPGRHHSLGDALRSAPQIRTWKVCSRLQPGPAPGSGYPSQPATLSTDLYS